MFLEQKFSVVLCDPFSPGLDAELSTSLTVSLTQCSSLPLIPALASVPRITSSFLHPFSLLLSVAAPRPRHLHFKRFSLFSRLPGKLRHVWVLFNTEDGKGGRGQVGKLGSWFPRCGFKIFYMLHIEGYNRSKLPLALLLISWNNRL